MRNLKRKRIRYGEIWSFVDCKQRNVKKGQHNHGDVWTALDAETNPVPCWFVGTRDAVAA
jgi:hypothetical protein